MRIQLHQPIEGRVRSIRVSFEGDYYFVFIQVLIDLTDPVRPAGDPLGVNRGVAVSMVRSDDIGHLVPVPSKRHESASAA